MTGMISWHASCSAVACPWPCPAKIGFWSLPEFSEQLEEDLTAKALQDVGEMTGPALPCPALPFPALPCPACGFSNVLRLRGELGSWSTEDGGS